MFTTVLRRPCRKRVDLHSAIPFRETCWLFVLPVFLLLSVLSPAAFSQPKAADAHVYHVGVAVVDITPDYPIRLNGFGNRREESEGVSQPIFAKAIAISDGDKPPLVLVTLDSLGIRLPMVEEVATRLQASHQLPRENLSVTFSHSHCTPKVNGACDNIFSTAIPPEHQVHIDRYTKQLTDHITTAAQTAINNRKPATLAWATGLVGFAKNRRLVGGPVDHDLPMLVVSDADTKKPVAIYVSYACHCVTLGFNQINGDWAGYAASMIERSVPGTVALVSIGAGSDQNPISGVTPDKVDVAAAQGLEIATEVQRLLEGPLRPIQGSPESVLNNIALPLNELPTREQLQAQTGTGRPTDKYNAQTQLDRLDRGEPLLSQIDYPIQTWTFGDSFCMTFLAGEVCVDYALRLKQELDRERFWLNTYSNDFCCYIPSERLVAEGGYGGGAEVPYFALPTTLKGGLETLIVDEVHRQVPDAFNASAGTQGVAPQAPEESLDCMHTPSGLKIVLTAAEPDVTDPVAIDFGPDGRLWVAEMNDYGQGVFDTFAQKGRIRWLRDTDGDGRFTDAVTFVDRLRFPTDVKAWRDGVLICDAPDIIFARDTNGDGKADDVQKLFTGFEVHNAQARVNSLRLGLDNWLYGAGGLFGGKITSLKTGQTVDCSNRDFRIQPDTGMIEPVSGRTQQGRDRNDLGDWFGCSNGNLLRIIASDDAYATRNPMAVPSSPLHVAADAEAYKLYPPENLVTFELSGAPGRATAACGLGIYRDLALGADFHGDAFTCEPVHQSVHRIDLTQNGYGYQGSRGTGEEQTEFLTSTDRWFRPVQARTGPDGALWVVDMYRYVIEHSRWIPQSTLAEVDVYAGQGRGRIYRILPAEQASSSERSSAESVIPELTELETADLVARLDSSNGTVRDTVHQLLLWRSPQDAAAPLRRLLSTADTPVAAVHALAVLQHLELLQADDVLIGLESVSDDVVRLAVQMSERLLDSDAELRSKVLSLVDHNNLRVRRQVALSLGASASQDAASTVAQLLSSQQDAHVRSAALNAVSAANVGHVVSAFQTLPRSQRQIRTFEALARLALQVGDQSTVQEVLQHLPDVQQLPVAATADLWLTILNGLDRRTDASTTQLPKSVQQKFVALKSEVAAAAGAEQITEAQQLAVIRFLGRAHGALPKSLAAVNSAESPNASSADEQVAALRRFVSQKYAAVVQRAAIDAMAATATDNSVDALIEACGSLTSDSRQAVVDVLLSRKSGPTALLAAVEAKQLRPEIFDAAKRDRLLSHADAAVRAAAVRVFDADRNSSRSDIVQSMKPALQLQGHVDQGREVFRKRCASCHRLEDIGHVVGPDLQALTNRDPEWLLTTILDPNRDVDARYLGWTAATVDGRTASGLLVEETATTILLKESGGKQHLIERSQLEELRSTQKSVMPEGLEKDLAAQDLSDVIAYVTAVIKPEKTVAATVPASADSPTELPRRPPQIAPFLLDGAQPVATRQAAIDARPGMGPGIVSLLVADLPADDSAEEYRRIPWIWRVAIAVGKRNDGGEVRDLLQISVPTAQQPLRDWQAVVLGGGVINGISQRDVWPHERIQQILTGLPDVKAAWPRTLQLAADMSDNSAVKTGTRYDALRMIALQDAEVAVPFLKKYLTAETHHELQMGAVSGLCDVNAESADQALLVAMKWLEGHNRQLAWEGLLRSESRLALLIQAIQKGELQLSENDRQVLQQQTLAARQVRALRLFAAIPSLKATP